MKANKFLVVVCFLIPLVGIIYYFVKKRRSKQKNISNDKFNINCAIINSKKLLKFIIFYSYFYLLLSVCMLLFLWEVILCTQKEYLQKDLNLEEYN